MTPFRVNNKEPWYYCDMATVERYGPLSGAELLEATYTGRLKPTDKVWQDGFQDWTIASEICGLFPETPKPVEATA